MPELLGQIENFTIAVGADVSNAIRIKESIYTGLLVHGKVVTDGAITYKYQVSPDNTDWYDLVDSAAAAVIPPLEGKAKTLEDIAVYTRIKSSANVTAVPKVWEVSAAL